MLAGAFLATIPLAVAPGAPPAGPLDADVVDTSAFPAVVIDFTVPPPLRSLTITVDMVQLGGGSVQSVAPVDPAGIVVSLVIDDGPTVQPDVVEDAQGASVELVRNVGAGTKIALATPSGLQTALTSDRSANIARIAGITAGAPDVIPLPELILDAAARLADSTETDRHLVLVLGSPAAVDVGALAAVVASGDIEVHVVARVGVDLGGLAELAAASGGVVPSVPVLLGGIDVATAAIAQRYRVAATVDGAGQRELAVVVDGARHTATVDLAGPAPTESSTTSIEDRTTVAAATPPPAADAAAATAAPQVTSPTTTATESSGGGSTSIALIVGAIAALLIAGVGLWVVVRRRSLGDDDGVDAAVAASPRPAPPAAPAPQQDPVPAPPAEPEPVGPPDDETVAAPKPARPQRVAAAARPRRSVSTRRVEPTPPAEPEQPDVPAVDPAGIEPETEWLVSGELRLRRSTGEVWSGRRIISLTPAELGVLELLMTSGDRGVTPDAIAEAAGRGLAEGDEPIDPDAVLTQLRRKTRVPGWTRRMRKERVMLYFLDDKDR